MKLENDIVVLVHGLGGSRLDMWLMARHLRNKGYEVLNWPYRSLGNRIETHARRLGEKLKEISDQRSGRQIHLVTHSMGGIILRAMLADWDLADIELPKIGRVVMLAPPHRGSHAARIMAPYVGWLTPSLLQLSDAADSYVNQLPNSLLQKVGEFGIVESTKDRVIAQGNVHLGGCHDYVRVDGHHGILTWYADTLRQVDAFLVSGKFHKV